MAFALFPLMVRWVDPFAVARLEPGNPEHTREFVKFAVFLLVFEWVLVFHCVDRRAALRKDERKRVDGREVERHSRNFA